MAHSTDYQGSTAQRALVADGFAILKPGPEPTLALREALFGHDQFAADLLPAYGYRLLRTAMAALMLSDPADWQRHDPGTVPEQPVLRHFSYSNSIRYY